MVAKVFEGSTVLEVLPYQYLLSLEFEVAIMQHPKENRIVLIGGRDDAGNSKSVEVWTSLVMGFSMLLRILKKRGKFKKLLKDRRQFRAELLDLSHQDWFNYPNSFVIGRGDFEQ